MRKCFKTIVAVHMILLLVLFLAGVGGGCNGENNNKGNGPDTVVVHDTLYVKHCPKVEHHIYITKDGLRCKIADENNDTEVAVNPQDWVTWHNEYGEDVQLIFGDKMRLFGVLKAIVQTDGPPLSLQVRPDATSGKHGYQGNCGATEPGPVIIVNPPN